jgi:hypothetical protein
VLNTPSITSPTFRILAMTFTSSYNRVDNGTNLYGVEAGMPACAISE